jgi:eukaryotic-like serine/threonine-protein kinase
MELRKVLRSTVRTRVGRAGRVVAGLVVLSAFVAPAGLAAQSDDRWQPTGWEAPRAADRLRAVNLAKQDGVDGNTYVSPTYGYELEWDEDVWRVEDEASDERDFLMLFAVDETSLVYVEGYEAYDGDPEECLEGSAEEILGQDGVSDDEPLEDEDGDAIAGDEDGVFFAAYSYVQETDDGTQDLVGYFTCQTLIEGEAVVAFSFVGLLDDFEDDLPVWQELMEGLVLPDDAGPQEDGEAEDEDADEDADEGEDTGDEDADDPDADDRDAGAPLASYRGGPAHTGEQPGPAPAEAPEELWAFETGDDFVGANAPAVSVEEGLVFTSSNAVYAIDVESGEEVWTYESEAEMGFVSPLALVDDVLYAAGEDGHVYAFEPESGEVIWDSPVTAQGLPVNGGPLVVDDTLYVTAWDETAYALDAESGEVLWDAPLGGIGFGQPAYADGFIVLSAPSNGVMALEAESGDEAWTFETDEQVLSAPALADGVAYFGSDDGNIYAVELESGDEVWSVEAGAPVGAATAVVDGVVYVANADGVLGAYDAESGDELWTLELDATEIGGTAVVESEEGDTLVFVGDGDGVLHGIDAEGEEVYTVEVTDAAIFWPVTVVDGGVYVAARDGTVYALAAED